MRLTVVVGLLLHGGAVATESNTVDAVASAASRRRLQSGSSPPPPFGPSTICLDTCNSNVNYGGNARASYVSNGVCQDGGPGAIGVIDVAHGVENVRRGARGAGDCGSHEIMYVYHV